MLKFWAIMFLSDCRIICWYIPDLQVNCGDRMAASCSDCPNEDGQSGCDGDCAWRTSRIYGKRCVERSK